MIGEHRAVAFYEIEKARDLLQIGFDIGIVATKVNIVELQIDNVLYAVAQLACRARLSVGLAHEGKSGYSASGAQYQLSHDINPPGQDGLMASTNKVAAKVGEAI